MHNLHFRKLNSISSYWNRATDQIFSSWKRFRLLFLVLSLIPFILATRALNGATRPMEQINLANTNCHKSLIIPLTVSNAVVIKSDIDQGSWSFQTKSAPTGSVLVGDFSNSFEYFDRTCIPTLNKSNICILYTDKIGSLELTRYFLCEKNMGLFYKSFNNHRKNLII